MTPQEEEAFLKLRFGHQLLELLKAILAGTAAANANAFDPASPPIIGNLTPNFGIFTLLGAQNIEIGVSDLADGSAIEIDFLGTGNRRLNLTLTGDITFSTTNRAEGRSVTVFIEAGANARTFTFPPWVWPCPIPAGIAANKKAILTLTSTDTTNEKVYAAYSVQP